MEKEFATTDRISDNTYVNRMLRIVRSLGRNLEGSHRFTEKEINAERERLRELDLYYAGLEERMQQARKG